MPTPPVRPPRGSRQGAAVRRRSADPVRGLPARDQPCEWCGVENGVYADRCAPWGSRCWLCYEAGPCPRDTRLVAARDKCARARVPRRPGGDPLWPCRAPPLSRRVATLEEKLRLLESRLLHPAPDGGDALRLG